MNSRILSLAAAGILLSAGTVQADEWSANFGASNNYIWRGLTQTVNEAAISGGIDYASDSGFYVGTWASNVSYAADDVYSYEHDLYAGFAGEVGGISYDLGYLYYNYDAEAEFDFGELYGSISIGAFTFGLNVLANTEADESPGQDFGFGEASYLYGVPGDYTNYNVSIGKDGFSFMITSTDLDDAGPDALDNDDIKFVIGYSLDIEL
jgi:uncharacterized protein (TIGR02001 family)